MDQNKIDSLGAFIAANATFVSNNQNQGAHITPQGVTYPDGSHISSAGDVTGPLAEAMAAKIKATQGASIEAERELFEAEIRKLNPKLLFVERWPDGSYKHHGTDGRWHGWQMARRTPAAQVGAGELHRYLAGLNQFIKLYCGYDSRLIACAEAAWYRCMTLNYPTGAAPASAQPADPLQARRKMFAAFSECVTRDMLPQEIADKLLAATGAQPDQRESTAEGWRWVPVKPTEEMHVAAIRTIVRCTGNDDFPPAVWAAMLAAAPSPAKDEQTCIWTEHPEDGYWRTACGRDWVIIDGTPTDHDMNHCHGCGKKLMQAQDSANNSADKQKGNANG